MRYGVLISFAGLLCSASAHAAVLSAESIDPSRLLPPPPMAGSPIAVAEVAELKAIAMRSTPEMVAQATHDAKDETPDIFNAALGFDIAMKPATFKLLNMVVEEEEAASKRAKAYFHRDRPWIVDATIATCTPKPLGPAATSYPSGHSTLAFSMGVVLASLVPEKAQDILKRSRQYAEHRLVCGVHFRSDITAGQQFGTVLALRMMEDGKFRAQMDAAKDELQKAKQ